MQSNLLAVLFALASALCIAVGTVLRHSIAAKAAQVSSTPPKAKKKNSSDDSTGQTWIQRSSARRKRRRENYEQPPILKAIRQPKWWLGILAAFAGYFFQIVALSFGTLLVVQPVLVLSLLFSLVISAKVEHIRMPASEIFWSIALGGSVAVLVVMGKPIPAQGFPSVCRWVIFGVIGLVVVIVLNRYASTLIPRDRALVLGGITGMIFGYMAVFSKAVVDLFLHYGIGELWHHWQLYALIFCSIFGTIFQQSSFNAGSLSNSLPAMTVTEPLVAFALSYAILGEKLQAQGWTWFYLGIALVVMVSSTIILSRVNIGEE